MAFIVISGPMFAGKTTKLIDIVDSYTKSGKKVVVFKPTIDTRSPETKIRSHDGREATAITITPDIEGVKKIKDMVESDGIDVVCIDEFQFFQADERIVKILREIAEKGKEVYVAGLNLDFRGEPWPTMELVKKYADEIKTLTAVCMYRDPVTGKICGKPATRTQRLINGKPAPYDSPVILVGGEELYQPRCEEHHIVPGRPKK